MTRRILFLLPVLAMGVLLGCGEGGSRAAQGPIAIFTAPAETVIAKVGGVAITVGDYRRSLDFEKNLYIFRNGKGSDFEKKLARFEERRLRMILPQLVHNALLYGYLDSKCGGREVANADEALAKFVKLFGQKAVKLGPEGLAAAAGVELADLRERALLGAREAKASLAFDPAQTTVSEKEIDEGLARLDAYKAMVATSNAFAYAVASNALAAVKAGEDFAAAAERFGALEPKEATEWGWFNRDDFDQMAKGCPAFTRWAFTAKVGDVGGPFDIDDGLSIVKVVDRQKGAAAASMAAKQVEEVQLVRINFQMLEENTEPRTREHCREALLAWKKRDAMTRLFTTLFNEAKIAYPNGDKLDFKVRKEEQK